MSNNDQQILEIKNIANSILNIPFKFIDVHNRLVNPDSKGVIGMILEDAFQVKTNSRRGPDIETLSIELKATPYKKTSKGISSKERLVITMINYEEEALIDSIQDSFLTKKMDRMLVFFYEHEYEKPISDWCFTSYKVFTIDSIPSNDWDIIYKDWQMIRDKIRQGLSHTISESDTLYLAACTKGKDSHSLVRQYKSDIKAKSRAFSLKTTYMTHVINELLKGENYSNQFDSLLSKTNISDNFLYFVLAKLNAFCNQSISEIEMRIKVKVNRQSKQYLNTLTAKMISSEFKDDTHIDEFSKGSVIIKTIRLKKDGTMKESISLPFFKFMDLSIEEWDESQFKTYLSESTFLFSVFEEISDSAHEYRFMKSFIWKASEEDIENHAKKVWEKTKSIINNGVILENKQGRIHNSLPKKKFDNIFHVRPHAANRDDTDLLPVPATNGQMELTKQCFWLNNNFILELIEKN